MNPVGVAVYVFGILVLYMLILAAAIGSDHTDATWMSLHGFGRGILH